MAVFAPILVFVGLVACAPRMRIPGPTRGMGAVPIVEHFEPEPAQSGRAARRRGRTDPDAERIARTASRLVGHARLQVGGEQFRADCSGFIDAVYTSAGQALGGSTADLFEQAREAGVLHHRKTPEVGDLAFFDDTYDRNRNGRRDDPLSHIAVVEAIAADGTVVLVHYGSKGVARLSMDLRQPDVHRGEDGVLRNSILRADGKDPRLTGELFRAWGSLWKRGGDQAALARSSAAASTR